MALIVLMKLTQTVAFRREYEDLPKDPQLREEILKIRAKYPPIPLPKPKPKDSVYSIVSLVLIVVGCIIGLAHGLYKAGIAFALLAFGS